MSRPVRDPKTCDVTGAGRLFVKDLASLWRAWVRPPDLVGEPVDREGPFVMCPHDGCRTLYRGAHTCQRAEEKAAGRVLPGPRPAAAKG